MEIPPYDQARFERGDEARRHLGLVRISVESCSKLPGALAAIERQDLRLVEWEQPVSIRDYYQGLITRWSEERYALDKRFVRLTLLLDQGEEAPGLRWQAGERFRDLREVLAKVPDPALVLLGPPGSGKSTLLRHYELDCARSVLANNADNDLGTAPLTFFIPLNGYKTRHADEPLPLPKNWLAQRWASQYPDLPPLEDLLRQRRLTLLLDALNEIPQIGSEAIRCWKDFLWELAHDFPGNRVIFSCRSLDYSATLSSQDLPVPQVRIEALSDEQVREFVQLYCPQHSTVLWRNLQGSRQLELLRSPYFLKLLVAQTAEGEIPEGRAALFSGFVRQALKREVEKDNPLFKPSPLFTQRDCRRLLQARAWRRPYELPTQGRLFGKLSELAFGMQAQHQNKEASQVRIEYEDALELLNHERAGDILTAGEALGILEEDLGRDEVLYVHQLMQEYFAARRLAKEPDAELVQIAWEVDRATPSLAETLAQIADSDPLPPLPGTGWEETTVLAAAMVDAPDGFVTALMKTNLALAGRCAAQPDVEIAPGLKHELQRALITRTQDGGADLRARIAAGLALGRLGDPRFERCQGPDSEYLLPPLVEIPGGVCQIGSDEGHYEAESSEHEVTLADFSIGKFPVTNAEWELFMQAGGYEDERWWMTEADKAWRRGESTTEGPKQEWREYRQQLQEYFDQIRKLHQANRITSKQADDWEQIARMSDEVFEEWLNEQYPSGRQTQPAFWNDDAFNNPAQPVVGVSWHEARAYCAWLSAQTGKSFRLPTEVEWEAAARGMGGRRYAYGDDFDMAYCNTFETHIRRTTPIGVFPGGETPEGLVDMTGNSWDWTSSLEKSYPYDATDGREALEHGDARRVVRGGSWYCSQVVARAAVRGFFYPAGRNDNLGFRVVCSSPI